VDYKNWHSQGCFHDNALSYLFSQGQDLTAEKCIDTCDAAGYIWAGVTEGTECWCGNIVKASAAVITECPLACSGNPDQICGGVDRMLIYQRQPPTQASIVPGYKTWLQVAPCYQDNNGGRALHHLQLRSDAVSVSSCLDACQAGGFILGGVEFGTECFCGNSIQYNNRPQSAPTHCYQPCGGDPSQVCGGPDALNLYFRGLNPFTTGPVTTLVQKHRNYRLTQCWQDEKYLFPGGARLLPEHPNPPVPTEQMTVERCIDACAASGYSSAGLEFSQECWCGNISFPPGQSTEFDKCNMPCTADARQYCGGPNKLLIYTTVKIGN